MELAHIRIECDKKPKKCPGCGHSPMASILYGMPMMSEELQRKIDKGLVEIGGCCITMDDPVWRCSRCGLYVYRKEKNTSGLILPD